MKEITKWQCDICGQIYCDKESASECEKKHSIPMKIITPKGAKWCDFTANGYFRFITVEMGNGKRCLYKFDSEMLQMPTEDR